MKRNNGGFSLVEVLVALVVVSLGVAAIMLFQGSATQETSSATVRAEATALATKQLAELQGMTAPSAFVTLTDNLDAALPDNKIQGMSAKYTRTWTVEQKPDGSKQVMVAVSWMDNAQHASRMRGGEEDTGSTGHGHGNGNKVGKGNKNNTTTTTTSTTTTSTTTMTTMEADNSQVVVVGLVRPVDVVHTTGKVHPVKASPCASGGKHHADNDHGEHTHGATTCRGNRHKKHTKENDEENEHGARRSHEEGEKS
ncbi:MAG: prepilin-type N-terminal cleavage/methylation domain-containing protein [Pseudomonadota bacterium]